MSRLGSTARAAMQRLHHLSLTARLVSVVTLLVLAAYVITTSLTVMFLRTYLSDRTDSDLAQYIGPLTQVAYAQVTRPSDSTMRAFVPPTPYYLQLTPRGSGEVLAFGSTGSPPVLGRIEWDNPHLGAGPFTAASTDGSVSWRVLAGRLNNGEGTAAVALPLTPMEGTVRQLWLVAALVGVGTLLAVAGLSWFAVRLAFRPLRRIEDTARAIAAGDLTRRVSHRDADDEIASLATSLNVMLARIEQSFSMREASEERMRRFVADASHELRTPLATVRGYAELYRSGAVSAPEDVAGAMRRIEDEATRMSLLVDDLLLLNRLDSERVLDQQLLDLTVLAADVVQDARVRRADRRIELVPLGSGGPVTTLGDDFALRQVLTNLVANALAHTSDDTPVEVAVGRVADPSDADRVVVEVRDHGPGIDPAVGEQVFERFFRADPSRARGRGGGSGLGLAIVAAIVGTHRGTVRHTPTVGGGTTFRVDLPAAAPPPAALRTKRSYQRLHSKRQGDPEGGGVV